MATERAKHVYEHMFQSIENEFHLRIEKAWVDYELALRDAIMLCYPNITIAAFWYQFNLAIRRKCKLIPNLYESIWLANASSTFHQFLCLPLLREGDIADGFNVLKRTASTVEPMRDVINIVESLIVEKESRIFP